MPTTRKSRAEAAEVVELVNDPAAHDWHLDKRIPVALIVALALNSGAGIWWAATTNARLDNVEQALTTSAEDHDTIVRMSTTLETIDERLERMDRSGNGRTR